jgi:hypothetical protein
MTIGKIRGAYDAQPFVPFDLHLADGRRIHVAHREFLASAPSGRVIIVFQPDDSHNVIDVLLVTDLEFGKNGRRSSRKPRRRR